VVSAGRTVLTMLRIEDFNCRTARARCVTTHLWTAHLWLACLFRSSHYARHDSRHHQSPLLSPPRQACLRHASRAQARAPTSPSSYHMSQIVRSPAYSAGLCAHDFSVCVPHPGLSLSAPCPPLRLNSADARLLRPHVSAALRQCVRSPI